MLNTNIKRVSFRFKDLLTVIQDKETHIRAFYNDKEINYNAGDIVKYKDYYVIDLGIGTEDNEPCIMIKLSENSDHIYYPVSN